MDLSTQPSPDEDRVMQRPLYLAGQTQPASVPTRNVATRGGTPKPTSWRRCLLFGLALSAWLLLLGGISYRLFLPNLEEIARERRAVLDDPNLTWEQKREKIREIDAKLTPSQGREVFQLEFKKWHHARNAEMRKFLQMSPEEQAAYMTKQDEERKQHRQQGGFVVGASPVAGPGGKPRGIPIVAGPGGPVVAGSGGKPGGSRFIFMGPGGGGPGGKPSDPNQIQKTMLDHISPETRAGMSYQRGLSR
jgi:hypothetical protein